MKSCAVLITTTENRISELEECLYALECQTLYPNEIIVIVDGYVKDKSLYDIKMNNLCFHFNDEILGSNKSRNIAISLSTMDLLFFCDDDDFFSPEKIQFTCEYFEGNPLIDAVYGRSIIYLENSELNYCSSPKPISKENNPLVKNVFGATSNYAINSEFLKSNNLFFDEEMPALQDWDFMIRVYFCGGNVVPLYSSLTHYRVKLNSGSISKSIKKHCQAVVIFEEKYKFGLGQLSKKELALRADNEMFTRVHKLVISNNRKAALKISMLWGIRKINFKFLALGVVALFGYKQLFYLKKRLSK